MCAVVYVGTGILILLGAHEIYEKYFVDKYAIAIICFWGIILPVLGIAQLCWFIRDIEQFRKEDEKR